MTIAVLGAGPHGREIGEHIGRRTMALVKYYDDHATKYPDLDCVEVGGNQFPWTIGAAWPEVRRQIAEQCDYLMGPFELGRVYLDGVRLGEDVTTGLHVHLGYNVVLNHGCSLGSFITVAAGATLGGDTQVGHDVFIGSNAVVIHGGIRIGDGAFVGAGAVVIDDVAPGVVVAGNPARQITDGWSHKDMISGRRGRSGYESPPVTA